MEVLGIDIGGSGIKGAPVNCESGELTGERFRIPTPQPATPESVADTVKKLVKHFKWQGNIGCGFPAVVQNQIVRTAANIDDSWIGINAAALIKEKSKMPTAITNDADAAGLAEVHFGAGKDTKGVILVITVGTGIGSALFVNGQLVPNTEFGHLLFKETIAEKWASDAVRKKEDLSWKLWAKRFNEYLQHVERLTWPDKIIIGGGISKKSHKYFSEIKVQAELAEAKLLNNAGIIGAAMMAVNI